MLNVTIVTIITLVLLEVVLRTVPRMIPPVLLIHFPAKIRAQIAKGRFLTFSDTFEYVRDDFGPPLRLMKPFTLQSWRHTDERGDIYTAQLDEIGFCNSPETYSRSSVVDIVTIGDSFTWCNAVKPEDNVDKSTWQTVRCVDLKSGPWRCWSLRVSSNIKRLWDSEKTKNCNSHYIRRK